MQCLAMIKNNPSFLSQTHSNALFPCYTVNMQEDGFDCIIDNTYISHTYTC